jgi:hypothetical protein
MVFVEDFSKVFAGYCRKKANEVKELKKEEIK